MRASGGRRPYGRSQSRSRPVHEEGPWSRFSIRTRMAASAHTRPLRNVRLRRRAYHERPLSDGNRRRCSCATANWSVAVLRLRRAVRMPKVTYELMEGSRFRRVAHFLRLRDDRTPALYIYDPLERSATFEVERHRSRLATGHRVRLRRLIGSLAAASALVSCTASHASPTMPSSATMSPSATRTVT